MSESSFRTRREPVETWFFTTELEGERAGSFRQERWCRVLFGLGATVRVFNVQGATGLTEAHFVEEAEFDEFRRNALAKAKPRPSVRQGWLVHVLRRVKHGLLLDFFMPNLLRLFLRARRLLDASGARVVIMCSSPPFTLAALGAILKWTRPKQIVLAVDMRDAWAMHTGLGGVRAWKRRIEGSVLRSTDRASTVSRGLSDEFGHAYGIQVAVLYNIATHYADTGSVGKVDWRALDPQIDPARFKLVYTGSTPESFYDLESLVGAVKLLRRRDASAANGVQLVFVGACEEVTNEIRKQGGVGNDIVLVGHQSHAKAKAIQKTAEGALFLAYHGAGNKGVVSTKFFEYLALGKPVLPLSLHEGSDVDQLLRKYAGRSLNLHTPAEIAAALAEVASKGAAALPVVRDPKAALQLLEDYRTYARDLLALQGDGTP